MGYSLRSPRLAMGTRPATMERHRWTWVEEEGVRTLAGTDRIIIAMPIPTREVSEAFVYTDAKTCRLEK